jgi:hypothetical protein
MNLPFTLPDWLPWWAFLILAIPALLYGLAFLLMPFSVFGVKSRLDSLEAQLELIQEEIRNLSIRPAERSRGATVDDTPYDPLPRSRAKYQADSFVPPIPPPPSQPEFHPEQFREPMGRSRLPTRTPPRRIEPRLD